MLNISMLHILESQLLEVISLNKTIIGENFKTTQVLLLDMKMTLVLLCV